MSSQIFKLQDVLYDATKSDEAWLEAHNNSFHQLDGSLLLLSDTNQKVRVTFGLTRQPGTSRDEIFFEPTLTLTASEPSIRKQISMNNHPLWAPLIGESVSIGISNDNRLIRIASNSHERFCCAYSDTNNQDVMRIAASKPETCGFI